MCLPLDQERFLQSEWSWENQAHSSESLVPHSPSKFWWPYHWCTATVGPASEMKIWKRNKGLREKTWNKLEKITMALANKL